MLKEFEINQAEDHIQKVAWRLVRSASDRMGTEKGAEKRVWCIKRIKQQYPRLDDEVAEDFIRAAYVNFKIETKYV